MTGTRDRALRGSRSDAGELVVSFDGGERMTDNNVVTVEAVRDLYAAALALDTEKALSYLHPDIVVREPSCLPYGGVYRGIDEFAQLFSAMMAVIDLSTIRVQSVMTDGTMALARLEGALCSGDPVELVEEWTVRDGRFATCQVFWFDPSPVLVSRG
jgi:hypothetical protein